MNGVISIVNINHGIKEPIHGHQNSNTNKILIVGGYVKVRECLLPKFLFG